MLQRRLGLVLVLAAASSATCARAGRDPLADTVLALDRSIDALTGPSADFRVILRDLASRLPSRADASVGIAIGRFLGRAPTAGADFPCSADFVRLRARQELIRIEERLLGTAPAPPEPQVCNAAPFAVDLARSPLPKTVEIYGYDFDLVPLQIVLVAGGRYQDVSAALKLRSHYHLSLVLGDRGVRLPPDARSLGLTWGNLIHHTIPIVAPGTPLCSCTIEEIPAGRTVDYAPPPVRPDRHSPEKEGSLAAWANAVLDYQSNELSATVCMTVTGPAGSGAVRSGCLRAFILTVAPERRIEWLFGRPSGRATYPGGDPDFGWRFAGFSRDSGGPRVTLELGKIRLVTAGGEGCISPIAYQEARRTGAISAVTARALDRQLAKLDPAIVGLRPPN